MPRGWVTKVKRVSSVTLWLVSLGVVLLLNSCSGMFRASQEEATEDRRTMFVRLELSPTNHSGVSGSATFAKAAAGTKIKLELRGLPQSHETYLAHLHSGSCEDAKHPDVPEGETASRHEHGYREHAEEIEYPLTSVESNAAGEGSSTTVLEGVALDELPSHRPKYLNVHAAGSGDPLQLACADLGEAS
jgi:Cu/Zn superoxide dismutase